MGLLNKLKAGPGQPNRGLIDGFLRARKWIRHDQTPEDWGIMDMPNEKTMARFLNELAQFEMDMKEGRSNWKEMPNV